MYRYEYSKYINDTKVNFEIYSIDDDNFLKEIKQNIYRVLKLLKQYHFDCRVAKNLDDFILKNTAKLKMNDDLFYNK